MRLPLPYLRIACIAALLCLAVCSLVATDYHVGPGQALTTIAQAPWATLQPGDRVYIHWKATPYQEKWVINRQGTAADRIEIIGVAGPNGEKPVIDGNGAITPTNLNFWGGNRGVIKIGGSSVPADGLPAYITIENLEIRSGRPPYSFTSHTGAVTDYLNNAASIYIEKGQEIIIRYCTLHDSGNGLFVGAFNGQTRQILIEHCHIYNNGMDDRILEHNAYTAAIGIIFQYNHFGPLRSGALGNNLKDRSAGLVVRYNWIESGNRQLDLVDAEDSDVLVNHPSYTNTHVYGNILIEPDNSGNSQVMHYGGDSGNEAIYRKGTLHLYNNTIISTRPGNTTLVRLSTQDESAVAFNNVIFTTAAGNRFAMIGGTGTLTLESNWLKTGWTSCHCTPTGSVTDLGNITGSDPLFSDFSTQSFDLQQGSPLINQGKVLPPHLLPQHNLVSQYVKHQNFTTRPVVGPLDIGAFEHLAAACTDSTTFSHGSWSPADPTATMYATFLTDYHTAHFGSVVTCGCTIAPGATVTVSPGDSLVAGQSLTVLGQLETQTAGTLTVQQ